MSHALAPNNELTEGFYSNMRWWSAIIGAAYRIWTDAGETEDTVTKVFLHSDSDKPHDWGFSGNDGQRMPAAHAERLGGILLSGIKDDLDERICDTADFEVSSLTGHGHPFHDEQCAALHRRMRELGEFMKDSGGFAIY